MHVFQQRLMKNAQYFENGVHKKWSGVGRVPVVIQQELDAGKPLESFLITTD